MEKYRKIILLALKIGVGSSAAIYIAQSARLEYAVSAGTITLLTLMTSKWETIKLSLWRLLTFAMTILLAWTIFQHFHNVWIAYGLLVGIIVLVAELFGLRSTISVNAVVAVHLLTGQDFSEAAILNEFLLVLIGIVIAILLNLFHANFSHKKQIAANMRDTEDRLQMILGELAAYLSGREMQRNVWEDICELEKELQGYILDAYEYQNNTFHSHPEYYIAYFEMRREQCQVLHNLHEEMKRIRTMPAQAQVIAEYVLYLVDYVIEINSPAEQIKKLEGIFKNMKKERLPQTREKFESRALLYHVLMDIEEFLICKKRFVEQLSENQLEKYWNHEKNS